MSLQNAFFIVIVYMYIYCFTEKNPIEMRNEFKSIIIDHQNVYSLVLSNRIVMSSNNYNALILNEKPICIKIKYTFQKNEIVLRYCTTYHSNSRFRLFLFINYVHICHRNGNKYIIK